MTIGEFKAFIDGMSVDEKPTKEQWARITEKVDELRALSIPLPSYPVNPPPYIPDTNPYPWPTLPIITCAVDS